MLTFRKRDVIPPTQILSYLSHFSLAPSIRIPAIIKNRTILNLGFISQESERELRHKGKQDFCETHQFILVKLRVYACLTFASKRSLAFTLQPQHIARGQYVPFMQLSLYLLCCQYFYYYIFSINAILSNITVI